LVPRVDTACRTVDIGEGSHTGFDPHSRLMSPRVDDLGYPLDGGCQKKSDREP